MADYLKNPAIQERAHRLILIFEDENARLRSWENLANEFGKIEAAGGVVFNSEKEVLIIHRKGWLDLPKGKMEAGESVSDCAMREVAEETGLQFHTLGKPLNTTFHVYEDRKKGWVIKSSHWFFMHSTRDEKLLPQTEEEITAIEWIPSEKLKEKSEEMYPLINDVLADALRLLND